MSGHSNIGPSAAERWINCPGSVALAAEQPPSPTSVYAAEGIVAHGLAEEVVVGKLDELGLMARVGEVVACDGHDVEVTEEMVEGVLFYRDVVAQYRDDLERMRRPAPVTEHAELRVAVKSVDEKLYGTADFVIYRKGQKLVVVDFKFGKGKMVSAVENPQLALYALGAMETVAGAAFDEIELVIVQPRALGDRYKSWVAPRTWLAQFKADATAAVLETRRPDARIKAGSWCRWCPAQAVCPAIRDQVQKETRSDFSALAPSETQLLEIKAGRDGGALPPVALMQPVDLARALDWEDPIEAWYGAIRERVQSLLESGVDVPGYKLVDGRANRKWADESGELAAAHFAPQYGERVYAPRKPLSVAQMEKLVGKKAFGEAADALVVRPEAPKKVARGDDPRPLAGGGARADFDPLNAPATAAALPVPQDPLDPLGDVPASEDPLMAELSGAGRKGPLWPV